MARRGEAGRPRFVKAEIAPDFNATWLNQIEVCFSAVQRKVLTSNEFCDLDELEAALLGFQRMF